MHYQVGMQTETLENTKEAKASLETQPRTIRKKYESILLSALPTGKIKKSYPTRNGADRLDFSPFSSWICFIINTGFI